MSEGHRRRGRENKSYVDLNQTSTLSDMGFRDQLKLYHQLEYKVNKEDPSVKQSLEDLLAKRPYYWR